MIVNEKLKYVKKTIFYLKRYRRLSIIVLILSLLSSVLEGFGITALIPLFHVFVNKGSVEEIPLIGSFFSKFPYFTGTNLVIYILFFILFAIILKNVCFYLNKVYVSKITYNIRKDLQVGLFYDIIYANLKFFHSSTSGDLIGNIATYTGSIAKFIFSFLMNFIYVSSLLIYIIILFFLSWKVTLGVIVLGLVFFPFLYIFLIKLRQISLKITRQIASLYNYMAEMFQNVSLIKIFSTEKYEQEQFGLLADEFAESNISLSKHRFIVKPATEVGIVLLAIAIILVVVIFDLDLYAYLPFLIAYFVVFFRFFDQLGFFLNVLSEMAEHIAPFHAYEKVSEMAKEAFISNGDIGVSKLDKEIRFNNVSFAYSAEGTVLNNLNFSIPKGKTIAIIGLTGAGKTTLVNLIAGLYYPTKGNIYLDDTDITDVDLYTWRRNIGYVSQDVFIFNETVSKNILYGKFDASQEDVIMAAKLASIDDFIKSLPNGYDTVLGERGINLSGGQRQRIAIARALIREPEVLILDEATSSLDNETEKAVQNAIYNNRKDRTIIVIAHHLSTVSEADHILVLKGGRIIEQGNHAELISHDSFYKYLYNFELRD